MRRIEEGLFRSVATTAPPRMSGLVCTKMGGAPPPPPPFIFSSLSPKVKGQEKPLPPPLSSPSSFSRNPPFPRKSAPRWLFLLFMILRRRDKDSSSMKGGRSTLESSFGRLGGDANFVPERKGDPSRRGFYGIIVDWNRGRRNVSPKKLGIPLTTRIRHTSAVSWSFYDVAKRR